MLQRDSVRLSAVTDRKFCLHYRLYRKMTPEELSLRDQGYDYSTIVVGKPTFHEKRPNCGKRDGSETVFSVDAMGKSSQKVAIPEKRRVQQ